MAKTVWEISDGFSSGDGSDQKKESVYRRQTRTKILEYARSHPGVPDIGGGKDIQLDHILDQYAAFVHPGDKGFDELVSDIIHERVGSVGEILVSQLPDELSRCRLFIYRGSGVIHLRYVKGAIDRRGAELNRAMLFNQMLNAISSWLMLSTNFVIVEEAATAPILQIMYPAEEFLTGDCTVVVPSHQVSPAALKFAYLWTWRQETLRSCGLFTALPSFKIRWVKPEMLKRVGTADVCYGILYQNRELALSRMSLASVPGSHEAISTRLIDWIKTGHRNTIKILEEKYVS